MAPAETITASTAAGAATAPKPRGRIIELDVLRGFLLLWMALTHLPTKVSIISNQTFGFVSGAEGFIFLSAFMLGWLEHRIEENRGKTSAMRDVSRRTLRVYLYHCALLAIAFTLVAEVGVTFHRLALENLLSFYLQRPMQAIAAGAILEYRPSLFDILPMYIIFMALTPLARYIARRWSWDYVIYVSLAVWAGAQFGLRTWIYRHVNLFGLGVPENSTGAFDIYAWQFLWMVGLALGSIYGISLSDADKLSRKDSDIGIPRWLVKLSCVVAIVFLVLRYCPADRWIDPNLYGWLIDKWHLAPVRLIDFSALTILIVRYGAPIARLPFILPLASLGQASIEVFCVHVLCCVAGNALSKDADPNLPLWEQAALLAVTISAMFVTAHYQRKRLHNRRLRAEAARA